MLIVCPNCSTSYMVDPASLGPAGRTVRCARCKTTWFAGGPETEPKMTAFVDGAIAEAEAQKGGGAATRPARGTQEMPPVDDFGSEPEAPAPAPESGPAIPEHDTPAEQEPPAGEDETHVALADAPSLVPPIEHPPLPDESHDDVDNEDIESYAARRQRLQARRKRSRRSSRWTAVVLLLFAFNVAIVGARDEVVRYLPQTASFFAAIGLPVNLRHLAFENVRISKDTQDGITVLVVEGAIVSTADKPVSVPRLRFAARNAAGQEIYTWTALPSRSILGPGEKLEFKSRLASPPADARNIMVRFFKTQDAAGAK